MSYYNRIADKYFKRAVTLAKRKHNTRNSFAIMRDLRSAFYYYQWAHMAQHAAIMQELLKTLPEKE